MEAFIFVIFVLLAMGMLDEASSGMKKPGPRDEELEKYQSSLDVRTHGVRGRKFTGTKIFLSCVIILFTILCLCAIWGDHFFEDTTTPETRETWIFSDTITRDVDSTDAYSYSHFTTGHSNVTIGYEAGHSMKNGVPKEEYEEGE